MKYHHTGIVVSSIENSINIYLKLGYTQTGKIKTDIVQNNRIVFLKNDSLPSIELIEAIDESSTVYKSKLGYHHICYESECVDEDIVKSFKALRVGKIFTKPLVAPALDNREVVFACLQNGTFIELII